MSLGARIRQLRKEQKMTLVDLAGEQITKGMLSLIENDKSKPSMETLHHIAKKLDVSIGYLTQEGDEAWTKSVLENRDFNSSFSFPFEHIEQEILPNLDKVAQNVKGMELYYVLRIYYRYKENHEQADSYSEKISSFYRSMGMQHLVVRDKLNDAISLMYSQDYTEAFDRLVDSEEEILSFKEYDSRIELDYYYVKGIFALSKDLDALEDILTQSIQLSYEHENFKYFFSENVILGYYYALIGEQEKYEMCYENIKSYLKFNRQDKHEIEIIDEDNPIPKFYVLVDDRERQARLYEDYINRIQKVYEKDEGNMVGMPFYGPVFALEHAYFKGNYEKVVEMYHDDMYIRTTAQYPVDRILMAIRSCVYPLSLYYLDEKEKACKAFNTIEATIDDIKDSIFTQEFYMIRDIIFEK
ncbi:helix-turn-helix domain-containing protein [Salinicoccus hispanicus]|uniref:Helix-turn-helix domain-containing protein n=1 Tax=Salinicoccus hispanicus TaxID=157225 RepID=A0A6N8U048_9STAP|nr:helix-turn-helix transcriptional regulator [Salinicoccus hispanicus]MXQ51440.1 helix-turn-helix domain-containing protein [Salinicoccus hispanicus]